MIRALTVRAEDENTLALDALICCQNPTLNPNQLLEAIRRYLPEAMPDFCHVARREIYDTEEKIFR